MLIVYSALIINIISFTLWLITWGKGHSGDFCSCLLCGNNLWFIQLIHFVGFLLMFFLIRAFKHFNTLFAVICTECLSTLLSFDDDVTVREHSGHFVSRSRGRNRIDRIMRKSHLACTVLDIFRQTDAVFVKQCDAKARLDGSLDKRKHFHVIWVKSFDVFLK